MSSSKKWKKVDLVGPLSIKFRLCCDDISQIRYDWDQIFHLNVFSDTVDGNIQLLFGGLFFFFLFCLFVFPKKWNPQCDSHGSHKCAHNWSWQMWHVQKLESDLLPCYDMTITWPLQPYVLVDHVLLIF